MRRGISCFGDSVCRQCANSVEQSVIKRSTAIICQLRILMNKRAGTTRRSLMFCRLILSFSEHPMDLFLATRHEAENFLQ